jgi:hypothetical protein
LIVQKLFLIVLFWLIFNLMDDSLLSSFKLIILLIYTLFNFEYLNFGHLVPGEILGILILMQQEQVWKLALDLVSFLSVLICMFWLLESYLDGHCYKMHVCLPVWIGIHLKIWSELEMEALLHLLMRNYCICFSKYSLCVIVMFFFSRGPLIIDVYDRLKLTNFTIYSFLFWMFNSLEQSFRPLYKIITTFIVASVVPTGSTDTCAYSSNCWRTWQLTFKSFCLQ